jgi:nitrogen fixation protein NifQ
MAAVVEEGSFDRRSGVDIVTVYHDIHERWGPPNCSDPFTAHVFACALTVGVMEQSAIGVSVAESIGLGRTRLSAMIGAWAPAAFRYIDVCAQPANVAFDDEEDQLRALFESFRGDESAETSWLVSIMTRRSMAPRHLWQDLGLRSREELSRLIRERFPALARRNTQNMKWKKFFYRCLCELEGFTLCSAPTCRECNDFPACFGDEAGESPLTGLK